MKPQIFKKAAELINQEYFACHALLVISEDVSKWSQTSYNPKASAEETFFHSIFKPKRDLTMSAYLSANEDEEFDESLRRELALLFAYHMAKDLQ